MEIDENDVQDTKEVEKLASYTRKYARSRTIPFIVQSIVGFTFIGSMLGTPMVYNYCVQNGYQLGIAACALAPVVAVCLLIWLSMPGRGSHSLWQLGMRLYDSEGQVSLAEPSKRKLPAWGFFIIPSMILAGMFHVFLIEKGVTSRNLFLPISVIYVTPAFVALYLVQQPSAGMWQLFMPVFYTLYASLVLTGLILMLEGPGSMFFNLGIPICGSMMLAMAIGHFYNRHVYKKIRNMSGMTGKDLSNG